MSIIPIDDESRSLIEAAIEHDSYANKYLSTKAEIIDYYQDRYGAKGWKQRIIHDMASFTGMKEKSLEKRFDAQRRDNPEKRNAGQYLAFGHTLPPIKVPRNLKGKRARVYIRCVLYFSGKPYRKTIQVTLTEARTRSLLENQDMDAIIEQYGNITLDDVEDVIVESISIQFV